MAFNFNASSNFKSFFLFYSFMYLCALKHYKGVFIEDTDIMSFNFHSLSFLSDSVVGWCFTAFSTPPEISGFGE